MSAPPRLYVEDDLSRGASLELDADQSHYLLRVMRLTPGSQIRLFNGRDGEWEALLAEASKKSARLNVSENTRQQAASPDIWLAFAPLKKAKTDLIIEKAVELGVSTIALVKTKRTQIHPLKVDRLNRIAVEAAEQTERLDIPTIQEPVDLSDFLSMRKTQRDLIFCDESGDDQTKPWGGASGRAKTISSAIKPQPGASACILVGPEGGFTEDERAELLNQENVVPVSLGPRILRAETAVIAALSIWQSLTGDWD